MNFRTLIIGPSSSGLKGGQVTHMENIRKLFINDDVRFYYSSSGKEGTENLIIKGLRLLISWCIFPFFLIRKKVVHLNTSFDQKAIIRDAVLMIWCYIFRVGMVIQYHGGNPSDVPILKSFIFRVFLKKLLSDSSVLVLTDQQIQWVDLNLSSVCMKVKNHVELPCCVPKSSPIVRFMYMGRIIREKGVFDIVDAISSIKELKFDVHLCGKGEDEADLIKAIEASGLGERIKYIGSVQGGNKIKELRDADVFLFPSYYPEGLPYSVLEAMSYECAVVCTDAGALEHMLNDGQSALKIEMHSPKSLALAMKTLVIDVKLRAKLSKNGRELIENEMSLPVLKSILVKVWKNVA
jgi:glycosyltransferase involved in cell wall biosynthesis